MSIAGTPRYRHEVPETARWRRWPFLLGLVGLLGLVSVLAATTSLVVAGHRKLSATVDEPLHVLAGMEWLERGTYTLWPENPPLSRIAAAAGPYLAGARVFSSNGELDVPAARVALFPGDDYMRTFELARRGILPLLLVSIVLVAALGTLCFGRDCGLLAAALFASLPPVLAHGGLATTDVPALAAFVAASLALLLWTREPTLTRSLVLGFLLGAAVCTKFSLVGFLLIVGGAFLVLRRVEHGASATGGKRGLLPVGSAFLVTTWAIFRFSHGTIAMADSTETLHNTLRLCLGSDSFMRSLADRAVSLPIPFPELFRGILTLCAHNSEGHNAYALGRISQHGFWYYFPLALAVKTPLPFLLLALTGVAAGLKAAQRSERLLLLTLTFSVLTMLGLSMTSNINIGVRHILPIYAPLALVAAYGARALWSAPRPSRLGPLLATALVGSSLLIGPLSFPDFLPYFNMFAGRDPSKVLLDSDLDWGQDLLRLETVVKERDIEELHIAYFGSNLLCEGALPKRLYWLQPSEPTRGWIAISEMLLKGVIAYSLPKDGVCDYSRLTQLPAVPPPYAWLERYQPVQLVGKSIRLYYIP